MKKDYELIGGRSHGETVAVDALETRLESVEFEYETYLKEPFRSEAYTKRRFAGEEFGDGYECYGLADDDDTDTRELARMELLARYRGALPPFDTQNIWIILKQKPILGLRSCEIETVPR